MQDQPHLVGERAAAAGAVGGELGPVQLDQVFGLTARAIKCHVDVLGSAFGQAGDDKTDVEAFGGGFDSGTSAPLVVPGFGLVAGLGKAAPAGLLIERPAGADVVGGFLVRVPVDRDHGFRWKLITQSGGT